MGVRKQGVERDVLGSVREDVTRGRRSW